MMEIYEEKIYDLLSKRTPVLLRSSVVKGAKRLQFQGLKVVARVSSLQRVPRAHAAGVAVRAEGAESAVETVC